MNDLMWDEWTKQLAELFDNVGAINYIDTNDDSVWKELYDDGMTPKEAFDEEVSYWEPMGDENEDEN